jgi:glycosyltransferase involved in cell wall biosynthesis
MKPKLSAVRVGYYIGINDPAMGGVAPYSQRLAVALGKHHFSDGIEFQVIEQNPTSIRKNFAGVVGCRLRDSWNVLTRRGAVRDRIGGAFYTEGSFRQFDLIHVPFQTIPSGIGEKPFVVTIHDVQELHFPEYFTPEERARRALEYSFSVKNAAAVVVSFEHVKQDILKFFRCVPEKVVVAPLPYRECELPAPSIDQSLVCEQRYKGFGRYILYPAQTWEHKNHLRLIEAFELARKVSGEDFSLVCAGHLNQYFFESIEPRVRISPFRSSIFFTGSLSNPWEVELRWLYENSLGVVIPTLYEAGSFPLIEAMALRVPVVCADTTSLPSTIGSKAFVFCPTSPQSIADSIVKLVTNDAFRLQSQENSEARTQELKNVQVGEFYEDLWKSLIPVN